VVTRAREQASSFLARLSELGAECIEFPTIEIIPPMNWKRMDNAIKSLEDYHWVLFTSVNGVKYFFERLRAAGKDARELKGVKVGTIGAKTAEAVQEEGITPDLVPDEYRSEAAVEAFKHQRVKSKRILLPRAAGARDLLPRELEKMGARVDVVTAYRTVKPENERARIKDLLEKGEIHMVTFTSSSTVSNFVEIFEAEGDQFLKWMERVVVACIGPVTAKTAEDRKLTVSLFPSEYTIEALTRAIIDYFASPTEHSSDRGVHHDWRL
jgi:uroporphyrinogen III methyltransferase/synthase